MKKYSCVFTCTIEEKNLSEIAFFLIQHRLNFQKNVPESNISIQKG